MSTLAHTIRGKARVTLPDIGKAAAVECVQVDALVVLKILKHARENPHEPVMGPLLGARLAARSSMPGLPCHVLHPWLQVDSPLLPHLCRPHVFLWLLLTL